MEQKNKNKLIITYQQQPGKDNDTTLLVKDNPFRVILSSQNKDIDFMKVILKAILVYSYDTEKLIPRVKSDPLTYELVPNDDVSIIVDMRVKVLSSQIENNAFRIKFTAYENEDESSIIDSICSDPIKVVSKRSQLVTESENKAKNYSNTTTIEIFNNYIDKMEKHQREQNQILENIITTNNYRLELMTKYLQKKKLSSNLNKSLNSSNNENNKSNSNNFSAPSPILSHLNHITSSNNAISLPRDNKRKRIEHFDNSLTNFVEIYKSLPHEVRIPKLKKLMSDIPKDKAVQLEKLLHERAGLSKEEMY